MKENGDAECITPNGNAATEESSTAVDNVTAPLAPSLSLPPSTQAPDGVNNDNEEEEMVTITLPTVTDVYFIIIDCTTMGYVDSVGVKILQQVKEILFDLCNIELRDMGGILILKKWRKNEKI